MPPSPVSCVPGWLSGLHFSGVYELVLSRQPPADERFWKCRDPDHSFQSCIWGTCGFSEHTRIELKHDVACECSITTPERVQNYDKASKHLETGATFHHIDIPPDLGYRAWAIDGLLEAHAKDEPSVPDGDWRQALGYSICA